MFNTCFNIKTKLKSKLEKSFNSILKICSPTCKDTYYSNCLPNSEICEKTSAQTPHFLPLAFQLESIKLLQKEQKAFSYFYAKKYSKKKLFIVVPFSSWLHRP